MTQSTRIYRHSAAGTDWAALLLGAGLGLRVGCVMRWQRRSWWLGKIQLNGLGNQSLLGIKFSQ
jgi:hypothetical protein